MVTLKWFAPDQRSGRFLWELSSSSAVQSSHSSWQPPAVRHGLRLVEPKGAQDRHVGRASKFRRKCSSWHRVKWSNWPWWKSVRDHSQSVKTRNDHHKISKDYALWICIPPIIQHNEGKSALFRDRLSMFTVWFPLQTLNCRRVAKISPLNVPLSDPLSWQLDLRICQAGYTPISWL